MMAYQILIVDDDPQFRDELACCLEDYKVTEASSGEIALQLIQQPNSFDLVILDVIMPGIHGTEVLKQIKRLKPKLPVIILTGRSCKDFAIEALKAHADDYIEKPFHVDKFLDTIRKVLASKAVTPKLQAQGVAGKVAQAKDFIERNFDKKITLDHIADQLCLSPKYFSRIFKQVARIGFNEYRLKVKTRHAAHLLKTTAYTINEISDQLGYMNTESFIRTFKQFFHQTPSAYRIEVLRKGSKRRV
jgi:YesN/AraC family two-component response regulator